MSVIDLSKVLASWEVVRETVKKSKESHDQPQNATCGRWLVWFVFSLIGDRRTKKFSHCFRFRRVKALNGFGAGFIGGFSEVKRVAMYWLTLMCSSTSGDAVVYWGLLSVSMAATGTSGCSSREKEGGEPELMQGSNGRGKKEIQN
jgi:hypothetical protein